MIDFSKGDKSKERFRWRICVGVSGHRIPPKLPNEAVPALYTTVCQTLEIFNSETIAHTGVGDQIVVSSLAEGADTIVAEAGLQLGFRLEAILPFRREEYASDFKSQQAFVNYQHLLERASAIHELGGNPLDRPHAYQAAGFAMLAKIDILIAIWDGNPADGVGGTGEIIERAANDQIPILWSNPSQPSEIRILSVNPGSPMILDPQHFEKPGPGGIASIVRQILGSRRN